MEYLCPDSGCYDAVFGYCASVELCYYYDPYLMMMQKRTQSTDPLSDLGDALALGDIDAILDLGDLSNILDPDALEA